MISGDECSPCDDSCDSGCGCNHGDIYECNCSGDGGSKRGSEDGICPVCGVYNGCGCDTGSCLVPNDCNHSGTIGDDSCDNHCCDGGAKDVDGELFCGECVLAVDETQSVVNSDGNDLKLCESKDEIHQTQMKATIYEISLPWLPIRGPKSGA